MGGKSTLRTRQKALDSIFSEWVRRSHAPTGRQVLCVTCDSAYRWDGPQMQAGHFWKRQHQATRYDPHNVHPQCVRCNMYRGGAEAEHAAYIIRTYGLETFQDLEVRHRQVKKWTRDEIESMIAYYRQRLEDLERVEVLP